MVVGGPRFLVFFNAADSMAIGEKIVLSGKSILSRKSRGFCVIIYRKIEEY